MPKSTHLFLFLVGILSLVAILFFGLRANSSRVETISHLNTEIRVWTAKDALERKNGLSRVSLERLEKDQVKGMLFLFPEQSEQTFWMKDMEFDLDVVWIRGESIVKIDRNIKAPLKGETPARMFSTPFKIDAVLELPAGGANEFGIHPGQTISLPR